MPQNNFINLNMNYYSLKFSKEKPITKNELKVLMLMYLTSDDFDVTVVGSETVVTGHLSYSLSNIKADASILFNPVYSTEFQNTIERFDKPIVETGDIVLAAVDRANDEEISKYFNEYVQFNMPVYMLNAEKVVEQVNVYLGVSNSSKSDFNTPFSEAKEIVVTSQNSLGELLTNTDF